MIVWSQIAIAGYLIGPLAGGGVAEGLSFAWIGLVPLVAAIGLAPFCGRPAASGRGHGGLDRRRPEGHEVGRAARAQVRDERPLLLLAGNERLPGGEVLGRWTSPPATAGSSPVAAQP